MKGYVVKSKSRLKAGVTMNVECRVMNATGDDRKLKCGGLKDQKRAS